MTFTKVCQLADEFVIKIAEHYYNEHIPTNIKTEDVDWITPEERTLIKENGTDPTFKPHNPPASISSEKTWDKAKKAVKKYWKKYDEPWAVVYDVYRKMGGKPKKKSKKKK